MNKVFTHAHRGLQLLGFDPLLTARTLARLPRFAREIVKYRSADRSHEFPIRAAQLYPILQDYDAQAGSASGHYFHQDLWAARKIFALRPEKHTDVGSRIDGFVAHVLTFMPVDVVDIRPLESGVKGLRFVRADATTLSQIEDNSLQSLSSLHAVEHFGLGRYGDEIDPDGWRKGMRSLARVLAPGGRLYFSVPVGIERLRFNGHRIFSPSTVLRAFEDLQLISFAMVDDSGNFHEVAVPDQAVGFTGGCGLFELGK